VSWDGQGRRPLRDKKRENQELRRLTVALMKVREDAVIDVLDIEPTVKEAIITCRSITEFRGRRRMERQIVNMLRSGDSDDLEILHELVENQEDAEEQLLEEVRVTVKELMNGDREETQSFLEEHPDCEPQRLRQLVRNAKKHQNTAKTAPYDKLFALVHECLFGHSGEQ
jgi:ribosome-associated protein